jgi:CHAT domain-containing protein
MDRQDRFEPIQGWLTNGSASSSGRPEALRRAMLAMFDNGEPDDTHPSDWAPFVVVGEGAAAK